MVKPFVTTPVTTIIIDMFTLNNNRLQPFTLSGKNGNVRLCGEGDQFRYRQNQVPAWRGPLRKQNVSELDNSFLDCNKKFPRHGISYKEQEV